MTPILRSAAIAATLSAILTTGLVAQSDASTKPANPACPLLTDQDLDATTGLNYSEGEAHDMGQGIFGGATCLWGGVWDADSTKSLPMIGVVFMPAGSHGSHTEFYRGRQPQKGCTRETLRGVGDVAFADSCQSSSPSMRVYVKAGRNDILLEVNMLFKRPLSWAQPVAVALAKAAAPRARKS